MSIGIGRIHRTKRRILFEINTAGQVHTWLPLIQDLRKRDYDISIVARDLGNTLSLLDAHDLEYQSFRATGARLTRLLGVFKHLQDIYALCKESDPMVVVGFGADAAVTAARLRKPSILFMDDDQTPLQNTIARMFSSAIITPKCFAQNLGRKQIRIQGFKEIAYLHPEHFTPDPSIFEELGIDRQEKYVIVRFNSWSAVHDMGKKTFSRMDQTAIVRALERYCKVFVSAEGVLSGELAPYRLPIRPHRIHHALFYAQLVLSNTGTMTTESAVLGTPALMCIPSPWRYGNYVELEKVYGLMLTFENPTKALEKAVELVQVPDLKGKWAEKRKRLLAEVIDVTKFFVDVIEGYPASVRDLTKR